MGLGCICSLVSDLISLSLSSGFIHIVAGVRNSGLFSGCTIFQCTTRPHFIYPAVPRGLLGVLPPSALRNSAAVSMGV